MWLVAASLFGVGCHRQTVGVRCPNTGPPTEKRRVIEEAIRDYKLTYPQMRPPGSVTVPVYFHILTSANGKEGNVSYEAEQAQIKVLNAAFAGNAAYGAAATPFKFVYAGTETKANDDWFAMTYEENPTAVEKEVKKLNKGGKGALNIYTARVAGSTLGWGRFPWNYADGVDGIVVRYSTLPGGIEFPNNEGDTATHEVGHWLGLYHTYEGNCEPPGDSINDTPPGKDPAKTCSENADSCPEKLGYDAIHNYMNATPDSCMNQFTQDQAVWMDGMHLQHRT